MVAIVYKYSSQLQGRAGGPHEADSFLFRLTTGFPAALIDPPQLKVLEQVINLESQSTEALLLSVKKVE